MGKVLGIGLNKTGTRSLAAATRMLGLRTLHKGDQATNDLVIAAAEANEPLLKRVGEQFDAYFDVEELVRRFKEVDVQYPGSKFILTTRGLDGWLDSRENHVRANQDRAQQGAYAGRWLSVDRDAWIAERDRHHEDVIDYFAERPDDLLILDVTSGDGWELLSPFLRRPAPRDPFPWENRAGAGTYRHVSGSPARFLVRARNIGRRLLR